MSMIKKHGVENKVLLQPDILVSLSDTWNYNRLLRTAGQEDKINLGPELPNQPALESPYLQTSCLKCCVFN